MDIDVFKPCPDSRSDASVVTYYSKCWTVNVPLGSIRPGPLTARPVLGSGQDILPVVLFEQFTGVHCFRPDLTWSNSQKRKGKGKGPVLDIALLHDEHMLRSALQSCKWQLIGMS